MIGAHHQVELHRPVAPSAGLRQGVLAEERADAAPATRGGHDITGISDMGAKAKGIGPEVVGANDGAGQEGDMHTLAVLHPEEAGLRRLDPWIVGKGVSGPEDRLQQGPHLGPVLRVKGTDLKIRGRVWGDGHINIKAAMAIVAGAVAISAEDRAMLAECMLESLHTSIEEREAAWPEEIALRIKAFEKGNSSAYSAEQRFAEAHQILQ